MNKRWVKPSIVALTILVICVVTLAIVVTFLGASLTSQQFPLSEKWMSKLQEDVQQITIVDNSIVIVRTMTKIYALDMQSGNILWKQDIAWHYSYHPPLAKKGTILLSDGKGVVALNQSTGKILWQQPLRHPSLAEVVDVTPDLVAVNDPPYITVFQVADGAFQWEKEVCRGRAQAYFFDAKIVVPCYGLNVMDALSGETIWETQSAYGIDRIWKSAFADGVIYFSQDLENITAYDVKNRKQLWKIPIAGEYHSFQAYEVIGNYLSATIDDQLCILHREDGRNAWCTSDLTKPRSPTRLIDVLYLTNGLRKGITAYNLHDGSQIGRLDSPAYIFITVENDKQLMNSTNELLIFAFGENLYAYERN